MSEGDTLVHLEVNSYVLGDKEIVAIQINGVIVKLTPEDAFTFAWSILEGVESVRMRIVSPNVEANQFEAMLLEKLRAFCIEEGQTPSEVEASMQPLYAIFREQKKPLG